MAFETEAILLMVLLALSAFFAAAEVSLLSVTRIRLNILKSRKVQGTEAITKLKTEPQHMIITILICNNLANVGASVLAADIATQLFSSNALGIATGGMTFLLLVFGEITPKSFAAANAEKIALFSAPVILLLRNLLYPVVFFFQWLSAHMPGGESLSTRRLITEDEIRSAVELGVQDKTISEQEKRFLVEALEFSDLKVEDVYTPRSRVFCIPSTYMAKDAFRMTSATKHWRFPIVDDKDRVIGITNLRRLASLALHSPEALARSFSTRPRSTSKGRFVVDLLNEMRATGDHYRIVEENGVFVGVVTLTDLLEEFVGESFTRPDV